VGQENPELQGRAEAEKKIQELLEEMENANETEQEEYGDQD
jgi:hypothetical protein